MVGTLDPVTGNVTGPSGSLGGGPQLTPEQRALAHDKDAWLLAEILHNWAGSPEGGRWFTKWKLNLTPSQMRIVHRAADLGIFRKDHDKQWWKFTSQTWPWLLTALALRDDWQRGPEAQGIRRAMSPTTPKAETNG